MLVRRVRSFNAEVAKTKGLTAKKQLSSESDLWTTQSYRRRLTDDKEGNIDHFFTYDITENVENKNNHNITVTNDLLEGAEPVSVTDNHIL